MCVTSPDCLVSCVTLSARLGQADRTSRLECDHVFGFLDPEARENTRYHAGRNCKTGSRQRDRGPQQRLTKGGLYWSVREGIASVPNMLGAFKYSQRVTVWLMSGDRIQ